MKKFIAPALALIGLVAFQATHIQTSGTLPANCTIGDIYIKTGSGVGFYTCNATNTWTGPITGSGSGDVVGPAGSVTDEALTRFDGTTGELLQGSLITLTDAGVLTFPDGVKQTFNPDGTTAGFNVGSQAGDPSSLANGDLWYDSTANELTARINGATVALGASSGMTCVVATGDDSDSDNTVHNDPTLSFSVASSTTYRFVLTLLFNTGTSNTPDAKYRFTLPASATLTQSGMALTVAATTTATTYQIGEYRAATPTAEIAIGVLTTATQQVSSVQAEGMIVVAGTAGTAQLQWAQNTTTGGTPTVRKADSKLCYQAQ